MHLYETVFILRPETPESRVNEVIDRMKESLVARHSEIVRVDNWGMRDLAYTVKKTTSGIIVVLRYKAEPQAVKELERQLKLSDDVIRQISVRRNDERAAADVPKEVSQEA
jgi:small subunit ribosomal protein S6